jgi:Oxidoreductase molybdopterin binding domain
MPLFAGRTTATLGRALVLLMLLSASLNLRAGHAIAQEAAGGFSSSFTVGGEVPTPAQFTMAGLQALPATTENIQFKSGSGTEQHSYTGVRLYDLLMGLGPQFDSSRKNDKLDWYVQVVGSDGYEAIVAWGEIDPGWEAKDVLVAYQDNGQPLGPGDTGAAIKRTAQSLALALARIAGFGWKDLIKVFRRDMTNSSLVGSGQRLSFRIGDHSNRQ